MIKIDDDVPHGYRAPAISPCWSALTHVAPNHLITFIFYITLCLRPWCVYKDVWMNSQNYTEHGHILYYFVFVPMCVYSTDKCILITMDSTQAQKLFPTYVPSMSLSLAWYQVSRCSVVRIPTGCSAGVGAALRIWWSSSTMWLPGAAARQPPGTSYKTSSLKILGGGGGWS